MAEELNPPYRLIRDALFQSRVIPFLGCAASLCSGDAESPSADGGRERLPSADELAEELALAVEEVEYASSFPPSGCSQKETKMAELLAALKKMHP